MSESESTTSAPAPQEQEKAGEEQEEDHVQIQIQPSEMPQSLPLRIGTNLCRTNKLPACLTGSPPTWYGCRHCSSIFQTLPEMADHKAKKHPERRTKLKKVFIKPRPISPKAFAKPPLPPKAVQIDFKVTDGSTVSTSKNLRKASSKHGTSDAHHKRSDDSDRIPCDHCTETFSTRKELQRHKIQHGANNTEKTINLGSTPPTNGTNESRISRRDLDRRGGGGDSSQSSSSHHDSTTESENVCPVCNKNFGFKDTLKRHLKVHEKADEDGRSPYEVAALKTPRQDSARKRKSQSKSLRNKELLSAQKGPKSSLLFRKSKGRKQAEAPVPPPRQTPKRNLMRQSFFESLSPESVNF